MRRFFFTVFILSMSIGVLWAQHVYNSDDYAEPGDSITMSSISLLSAGSFNFDLKGPGVTWDFSSFNPVSQKVANYLDPNRTGFAPTYLFSCYNACYNPCFNNCVNGGGISIICAGSCNFNCNTGCLTSWANDFDLAEQTNDSLNLGLFVIRDIYNFYNKTNSGLYQVSTGVKVSGLPFMLNYQNHDEVVSFPITYGDASTSRSNYGLALDSIPGSPISFQIGYSHGQFRENFVEGWGTLITPYGTFDSTLKVRSSISTFDSVVFQGDTLTLAQFLPNQVLPDSIVEYRWFHPDFKVPLLKTVAWVINNTSIYQSVDYIDSLRCFDPFAAFGYLPFPALITNANDSLDVNFYSIATNTDSLYWDFDGNGTATGQSPSAVFTEGGTYDVSLVACNTSCVVPSCDTITIPVLIIDASDPTGIVYRNESDIAIKAIPNPFDNELTVQLEAPAEEDYQIVLFDLIGKSGKPLKSALLKQGTTLKSISTGNFAPGVYLLMLKSGKNFSVLKVVKN